jgi:hypothetical protein
MAIQKINLGRVVGEKGDTGKSAYEVAVDNGFSGTEKEWLTSLICGEDVLDAYMKDHFYIDDDGFLNIDME